MVEPLDNVLHHFAQLFKIDQQPGLIEFFSGEGHADFVVVPVRLLALAFVVAEIVAGRKLIFDGNFVHEFPWPA